MARHRTGAERFELSHHGVKVRCVKPLRHTPKNRRLSHFIVATADYLILIYTLNLFRRICNL